MAEVSRHQPFFRGVFYSPFHVEMFNDIKRDDHHLRLGPHQILT